MSDQEQFKSFCFSINTESILQYSDKKLGKLFSISGVEARKILMKDYRAGHDVYTGCDNRDSRGSCLGHPLN